MYSFDGTSWATLGLAPWSPRVGGNVAVYADRLFLIGGMTDRMTQNAREILNDVWSFFPIPPPPTPKIIDVTTVSSKSLFVVRYQPVDFKLGYEAPIEEAYLESLDGSRNATITQGNTFSITDAVVGKEYQFHMKLRNRGGWGNFSLPTPLVKIPVMPIAPNNTHNNTHNNTVVVYPGRSQQLSLYMMLIFFSSNKVLTHPHFTKLEIPHL